MPLLNFGDQKDHATAIAAGVRGLDTALTYGDKQQREVGKAMRESGVARSELFVTTKIPCCPTHFAPLCHVLPGQSTNATENVLHDLRMLGLDYVDLVRCLALAPCLPQPSHLTASQPDHVRCSSTGRARHWTKPSPPIARSSRSSSAAWRGPLAHLLGLSQRPRGRSAWLSPHSLRFAWRAGVSNFNASAIAALLPRVSVKPGPARRHASTMT